MKRTTLGAALAAVIAAAWICTLTASAWAQCGQGSPAEPVEQYRAGRLIWPPSGLRPGLPGQTLPSQRDSTDYLTLTIPGLASGHELFQSVAALPGRDLLFVAYNAGVQVWDVGAGREESPLRLTVADGWAGDFPHFPLPGEADTFVTSVDVIEGAGGEIYLAASGLAQVGTSLWLFDDSAPTPQLTPIAQHPDVVSRQVRMGRAGGSIYAYAASSGEGVVVFDAASGERLGSLGGSTEAKRYLDVLERGGTTYVAASWGTSSIPVRLYEHPGTGLGRELGSDASVVHGVALFEIDGRAYLAYVQEHEVKIFDVEHCLDADGCADFADPVWNSGTLPGPVPASEFLTFSYGGLSGEAYLYYGVGTSGLSGPSRERLWDVSALASGQVTDLLAGGDLYLDSCSGELVDYFGDYYEDNQYGLRHVAPREAVWNGRYLYRAAVGILDVHVLDAEAGDPVVSTQILTPPPHWLDEPVNLSASSSGCGSSGTWTWESSDPLAEVVPIGGNLATLFPPPCPTANCSPRLVEAWAIKSSCAGDPNLVVESAEATFFDPRPQAGEIEIFPQGDPPRCTHVELSASASGRDPLTQSWEISHASTGEIVAEGSGTTWTWDTTSLDLALPLFVDGFESGTTVRWDTSAPEIGEPFDVRFRAANDAGIADSSAQIRITVPGALRFLDPPLTAEDLGLAKYRLQARTLSASEWRFEVENDLGEMEDQGWQRSPEITYQWLLSGPRSIRMHARSCGPSVVTSETTLEVVSTAPLEVSSIWIDVWESPCSFNPLSETWTCEPGEVFFIVSTTGDAEQIEADWGGDGQGDELFGVFAAVSQTFAPGTAQIAFRALKGGQQSDWASLSFQVE